MVVRSFRGSFSSSESFDTGDPNVIYFSSSQAHQTPEVLFPIMSLSSLLFLTQKEPQSTKSTQLLLSQGVPYTTARGLMSLSTGIGPSTRFSQRINPLVPESTNALLAEEWTIDPNSTLPSFLEMVMIEEAQRSAWQTLKLILGQMEDRIRRWHEEISIRNGARDMSIYQRTLILLKVPQLAKTVSEDILANFGSEIQFLIMYLLERRSLISSGAATMSEALHGTKRVKLHMGTEAMGNAQGDSTVRQGKLTSLKKRDGIRYATLLVLGRYLLDRGNRFYEGIVQNQPQPGILPIRLQNLFRFLYPFLYLSSKGLNLVQRWQYLLGDSVFFDPYSKFLGLVVRRVVADDAPSKSTDHRTSHTSVKLFETINDRLSSMVNSQTFRRLSVGLLSSVIGISWIARLQITRQKIRMKRHMIRGDLNISAPHKPLSEAPEIKDCPATHCPLCRSPRINPTASTSGYVFCLSCLTAALRSKPVCPITGKDCPESSVIRLFEPNA